MIAVGPRIDFEWIASREAYLAKLDGMIAPVPRLGRDSDLAVLPEDVGLLAAFSGARGAPARTPAAQAGGVEGGIATLAAAYATPSAYYAERYPELTEREVPTRLLALALTDTFGRVAVESFAEIADRYDLWLAAGVNMARDWKIVCRDQATYVPPAGGEQCVESDPDRVALLGDPAEPARDYVYEATKPEPVNMALLFDPDGRLVSKQVKAYLTPAELPGALDLVPGDPDGLEAVDTPVGRLGFVTSKDAWMPDVTSRLDRAGVEILVQPEFFVGDTVRTTGPWAPDTLKASGYSDLLRHPSFKVMALPELTGDLYDFSADAQSHIAVKPYPGGPLGGLVGQQPAPGFAQVQPWLAADPLDQPLPQRRAALGAAGEAAVGSGMQQEGVIVQDVEVDEQRPYRPVDRDRDKPIDPARKDQRNVAIASKKRKVYVAWEEGRTIRTAISRNAGRHFSKARIRGAGTSPSVSVGAGGTLWLAYTNADGKVVAAEGAGRAKRIAPGKGDQDQVDIVALGSDGAYAVWIDDKSGLYGVYGGVVGDFPERLDQGKPVEHAEQLDNAWAPTIVEDYKQIVVAWSDFRNYQWDVYARVSEDRGDSFSPQVKVNDTAEGLEALNDSPQAAILRGDPYVAWTDFRKRDDPGVSPLYDIFGARVGQANQRLDRDGRGQRNAFSPAAAQVKPGGVAVAWQSHRRPTADVVATLVGGDRVRVDDAGGANVNSWRPAIADLPGNNVIVAWEDDRDGPRNIFMRRLSLR